MANRPPEVANGSAPKATSLNCISLSAPDISKSVSLLKQACLDSGFFYVIDHGISQDLMDEVFVQSKKLFDLPLDEKMKLLRNEKHRGYTPILDETLDPDNQITADGQEKIKPQCRNSSETEIATSANAAFTAESVLDKHVTLFLGDYKEGYYIGVEVPEDDPQAEKPFYGPNLWASADILSGWRETMELYHKEALRVARAVARIIALALDLDADFFDKPGMLDVPIATLRLLHYQGKASDHEKGIFGAGAHSDYGLITLLATDDVMGLQICKDKDAKPQVWEYVLPIKGGFTVNLGDMLERWSNGIFRSTLHRVIMEAGERYSIAYFVEPSHECLVECLPTCKSESNPPKFPAVTCSAYLLQRYKDTHADLSVYGKDQS